MTVKPTTGTKKLTAVFKSMAINTELSSLTSFILKVTGYQKFQRKKMIRQPMKCLGGGKKKSSKGSPM